MRRALLTVAATTIIAASSAGAVVAQTDASVEDVVAGLPESLASLYPNYSGHDHARPAADACGRSRLPGRCATRRATRATRGASR